MKEGHTSAIYVRRNAHAMKSHTKTHSGKKPLKCTQCEYATNRNDYLKMHLLIHTGEKSYKCSQCDFATGLGQALKRHLMNTKAKQMQPMPIL